MKRTLLSEAVYKDLCIHHMPLGKKKNKAFSMNNASIMETGGFIFSEHYQIPLFVYVHKYMPEFFIS